MDRYIFCGSDWIHLQLDVPTPAEGGAAMARVRRGRLCSHRQQWNRIYLFNSIRSRNDFIRLLVVMTDAMLCSSTLTKMKTEARDIKFFQLEAWLAEGYKI